MALSPLFAAVEYPSRR